MKTGHLTLYIKYYISFFEFLKREQPEIQRPGFSSHSFHLGMSRKFFLEAKTNSLCPNDTYISWLELLSMCSLLYIYISHTEDFLILSRDDLPYLAISFHSNFFKNPDLLKKQKTLIRGLYI